VVVPRRCVEDIRWISCVMKIDSDFIQGGLRRVDIIQLTTFGMRRDTGNTGRLDVGMERGDGLRCLYQDIDLCMEYQTL
jgi:hypothetical protein